MVGKGAMSMSAKPIDDLGRRWRAPTRSWPPCARPPARSPSTWSAAPSATCCSAAGGPTSTSSSRATPPTLAARLGAERGRSTSASRPRRCDLDGHEVDIASARAETYPHPGALPEVEPARPRSTTSPGATSRSTRWRSRCAASRELIDPHGGRADLEAGLLRVLHPRSFVDDPTRALRAARYAARFGFELEPETETLLREADLDTVSVDRREAELLRLAAEAEARPSASSCSPSGGWSSCARAESSWPRGSPSCSRARRGARSPRAAGRSSPRRSARPAARRSWPRPSPARPSEAVELARGHNPVELVLARALGAEWLDRYVSEWRSVALEIDGDDLIAAGVPQGPAIGRGLRRGAAPQARRGDRRPRAGAGGGPGGRARRVTRLCLLADGVARERRPALARGGAARCAGGLLHPLGRRRGREPTRRSPPRSASPPSGSRSAARSTAPT